MKNLFTKLIAVAMFALPGRQEVNGADAGLPDVVRIGLEGYASLDPLAVTFSVTHAVTPLGREKIPADMVGMMTSLNGIVIQLAFREGAIYQRSSKDGDFGELAFDRKILAVGSPKTENRPAALLKRVPEKDDPNARYFSVQYFRAAGVRIFDGARELSLLRPPKSKVLDLLGEGGEIDAVRSANLDSRILICVQLTAQKPPPMVDKAEMLAMAEREIRSTPLSEAKKAKQLSEYRKFLDTPPPRRRYDFYLDPRMAYAVRQLEIRDDAGRLLTRSLCSEHEQINGRNVWLPRFCKVEEYTFGTVRDPETLIPLVFESPLSETTMRVINFDVEPWPDERFELKYTAPGTTVHDATLPEVKSIWGPAYTIPANPQKLDAAIEKAREAFQTHENAEAWSPTIRVGVLVVNGIILVCLLIYVGRRLRRKAAKK